MTVKVCANCKFFRKGEKTRFKHDSYYNGICLKDQSIDIYSGEVKCFRCSFMRDEYGICGEDGRLFEDKPIVKPNIFITIINCFFNFFLDNIGKIVFFVVFMLCVAGTVFLYFDNPYSLIPNIGIPVIAFVLSYLFFCIKGTRD